MLIIFILKEILMSCFVIFKKILKGVIFNKKNIESRDFKIQTKLTGNKIYLFAYLITLIPGTIVFKIEDQSIYISTILNDAKDEVLQLEKKLL